MARNIARRTDARAFSIRRSTGAGSQPRIWIAGATIVHACPRQLGRDGAVPAQFPETGQQPV